MSRLSVGLADFGSQALSLGMVCYTPPISPHQATIETLPKPSASQPFCISPLTHQILYTYHVPSTGLGTGDTEEKKTGALLFQSLNRSQEEIDSKTLNKSMNEVISI